MAEGLARKMLGTRPEVESAGTNAHVGRASSLAIEVMRSRFRIDISAHNSRNVHEVSMNDFDYVVAMDNMVADDLRSMYPNINAKLITWNIDDPIGRGIEAYEKSAGEIDRRIEELSGYIKETERKG
jgi:protein-tyrosine-phosphatase